jgi:hypothetical protein
VTNENRPFNAKRDVNSKYSRNIAIRFPVLIEQAFTEAQQPTKYYYLYHANKKDKSFSMNYKPYIGKITERVKTNKVSMRSAV